VAATPSEPAIREQRSTSGGGGPFGCDNS